MSHEDDPCVREKLEQIGNVQDKNHFAIAEDRPAGQPL